MHWRRVAMCWSIRASMNVCRPTNGRWLFLWTRLAADARRAVACLSQPPARLGGDVQREQMNHSVKFWKRVLSGYGTDYDGEDSYA